MCVFGHKDPEAWPFLVRAIVVFSIVYFGIWGLAELTRYAATWFK